MHQLTVAADNLVDANLALKKADSLLLITNGGKERLARALAAACALRGIRYEAVTLENETEYELPPAVLERLLQTTGALISTGRSYTHTDGVRAAAKNGARIATNSRLSQQQLVDGLMVDYEAIAQNARRYAALLDRSRDVLVRSAGGAELRFTIGDQRGLGETGLYTSPGAVGNLPAGEAACGIDDDSGEGVLVVDGSWPGLGLLSAPLELTFKGGSIVHVSGALSGELEAVLSQHGPRARSLAELGLGMNPALKVQGNTLLDEKVAGTIHVAVGNDVTFGGTNNVSYHADGVVVAPELFLDGVRVELPAR